MRIILLVILSSLYFNMYSQSEEAKNKILLVQENLEQVPPYSCEIKIKIAQKTMLIIKLKISKKC